LKSRRAHAATEPIPEGWIPCAHLYPGHPVRDEGDPFDAACHDSFQRMIERFGLPECLAIKRRVMDAIGSGESPSNLVTTLDRHGRTGVRIALRQLKAAGTFFPMLNAWLAEFDHTAVEDDGDEVVLQHPH
jgi:hypothetical protein